MINKDTKVYYRMRSTAGVENKTYYLHVFTGRMDRDNEIIVEKSLIEIGRERVFFPREGDTTTLGSDPPMIKLNEMMHIIIDMIFTDDFNLSGDKYSISHIQGGL